MKIRITTFIVALCVMLSASLLLTSCNIDQPPLPQNDISSTNLSKDYSTPGPIAAGTQLSPDSQTALENFSMELFKQSYQGGNLFMSPVSVLYALAMVGNGASGETLAQMEQVFGADIEVISASLRDYMGIVASKDNGELSIANSLWIKEGFPVSPDFLAKNSSYFGAEVFSTPMNNVTVRDVNLWCSNNTNGMIPKILDEDSIDSRMTRLLLVNALRFEALWRSPYNKYSVSQGTFTDHYGQSHTVDMMYSSEDTYIETENATGFIKHYEGNYAFAAILPNSDVSLKEYVNSLTGRELHRLLNDCVSHTQVNAAMPKFSSQSSLELPEVLMQMGMIDAFADKADFSGINSDNLLYIKNVIHKTKIEVSESGTKAAAVTAVVLDGKSEPSEYKTVTLDRPFLYMIIDCTTMKPLFVGAYASPAE